MLDLSYAKSQAVILRRIANRLRSCGLLKKDSAVIAYADHFENNIQYLMNALDMNKEER